jgi:ADP-ribosylglycohydrolase
MRRARVALDGLSVGDAFGQQLVAVPGSQIRARRLPPPIWRYTDDTEMGLAVFEVLDDFGFVHQDDLARVFARRWGDDMYRGYGSGAHRILSAVSRGEPWRDVARREFNGAGSMGNGSAMRVAPVGAYFADDLTKAAEQALCSAEVTHAHPEGVAGAVAVTVAAAYAWQARDRVGDESAGRELFEVVLAHTAEGTTRRGVEEAAKIPPHTPLFKVVPLLGNGSNVTCPDTVPFCLWCAARDLHHYEEALWTTVQAGGDMDTTAAIVGSIVVLATGRGGIPAEWLAAREPLIYRGGELSEA